jgi:hypothetical protein
MMKRIFSGAASVLVWLGDTCWDIHETPNMLLDVNQPVAGGDVALPGHIL